MAKTSPLTRRGFLQIAGRYGFTSTAIATASLVGPLTLEGVGKAAAQTALAKSAADPAPQLYWRRY